MDIKGLAEQFKIHRRCIGLSFAPHLKQALGSWGQYESAVCGTFLTNLRSRGDDSIRLTRSYTLAHILREFNNKLLGSSQAAS